jgi:hypothetical protein
MAMAYGHWFMATALPMAKPSLSGGITTQPSLRLSVVKDKYPDPSGSAMPSLQRTGINRSSPQGAELMSP